MARRSMIRPSRREFLKTTGSATVLTTFAGCSGNQNQQNTDTTGGAATNTKELSKLERWAKKGKQEENGQVNIAHFLAGETSEKLFEAFKNDIPWLNPKGVKFSGGELTSRIEAASAANNLNIDMVWVPSVPVLGNKGLLEPLQDTLPVWDSLPKGAKGKYWIPNKTSSYGLLYNSSMISKEDLPKNWVELAENSKYRNRIIMGQSLSWVFPGLKSVADRNDGWLDKFAQQDIRWASGLGAAIKQCAAGSKALNPFTNLKYPWIEGRAAGSPVKVATPTEPVFLYVNPSAVTKKAPHKNTAMYLANYLGTEKGQKSIKKAITTDCAGLSKETLSCNPPEMNKTLHEGVDDFRFVPFLGPQEYNQFASKFKKAMGL